jgi:hypothetical protein
MVERSERRRTIVGLRIVQRDDKDQRAVHQNYGITALGKSGLVEISRCFDVLPPSNSALVALR